MDAVKYLKRREYIKYSFINMCDIRTSIRNKYVLYKAKRSDSMEFDTIDHDISPDKTLSTNTRIVKDQLTNIDFFIKQNNDTSNNKKVNSKNKKNKKKHRSKILMNLLNTELATQPLLIENIVIVNENSKERNNCLREFFCIRYENRPYDAEVGMETRFRETMKLIPTFPRLIENTSRRDSLVNYLEPVYFSNLISLCCDNELKQRPKFLDIIIKDLKIICHHEFTLENLLCIKLDTIFKKYQQNRKDISNILKEITVNRNTRNNLKDHLLKICPNKKGEICFDKTILKYTQTMLQLKEKYYIACQVDKQVIHQLMSLWADIENIRSKSGIIHTSHILQMNKVVLNDDEQNNEWLRVFEEEYSDMLIKLEYDYIVKYLEYKEWKQSAKDKQEIKKPKLHVNNEELKNTVDNIVNSILVRNKIDMSLIKNEKHPKMLPNCSIKHRHFFKVYVDDVFVCQSDEYYEKEEGKEIDFLELFTVQILSTNQNIEIILFEDNHRVSSKIIELHKITKVVSDAYFEVETFTCDQNIEPSSKIVGSGYTIKNIAAAHTIRLKSSNLFKGNLINAYESSIKIGWNDKMNTNDDKVKSFINLRTRVNRLFLGKTQPSVDFLLEVISDVYGKTIINDENIMNALKQVCEEKVTFENTLVNDFNKRDEVRFKLLCLRNSSEISELNNVSIPLQASQISTEQLDHLIFNSDLDVKSVDFDESTATNSIDLQRFMGVRYVTKLNKRILENIHDFLLKKTYKDVVRDFEDLSLRSIFTYQPRFNLNATSSLTKQGLLRGCLKQEQEIRVTILRAHNLLDRVSNIDSQDNQSNDDTTGKEEGKNIKKY